MPAPWRICEARQHEERISRLYELAARFQDRDPESPGYGNLRWYWRDERVTDQNAVEFCMQDALLTWIYHRQWMPEQPREQLRQLMTFGIEGCMRHRVRTSYTNIALLNAANLIGLGEAFDRPEVSEEGYRRLDLICLWTWRFGTCEYCSPSYYGVDLQGIHFIEGHAQRERGRRQAQALARLFWTDIAANWFAPAQRFAGAHSRTYDYLRGLGSLDRYLQVSGWIDEPITPSPAMVHPLRAPVTPPTFLDGELKLDSPRLVRQSWGQSAVESRTHMLYDDVTLSSSAANYGAHDMPLTVDLPGDRQAVRCYFIPDGREDPYGQVKYPTGSARHPKALHLKPFWTAAQRTRDALGLVVYRDGDLEEDVVANLQSHFVLRRQNDGIWLNGKSPDLTEATKDKPARTALDIAEPLVVRYGTAAIGIRVLWARAQDATPPAMALVDDGNEFGAMRLTIDHRRPSVSTQAGAAFWARVGSGLVTDEKFHAWRSAFEAAEPTTVDATPAGIRLEVPGADGPVSLSAAAPFGAVRRSPWFPSRAAPFSKSLARHLGRMPRTSENRSSTTSSRFAAIASSLPGCSRSRFRPGVRPLGRQKTGWCSPRWSWSTTPRFRAAAASEASKDGLSDCAAPEASPSSWKWPRRAPITCGPGCSLPIPKAIHSTSSSTTPSIPPAIPPPGTPCEPATGNGVPWPSTKPKNPAQFTLPAGRTPLQFRVREPGTKLDRVFITRDASRSPEEE